MTPPPSREGEGEGDGGEGDHGGDDDGWIRGSLCHEIPGSSDDVFCTFTHLSFNDGLGVSIVTTPEVFAKLSALPVFTTATPSPQREKDQEDHPEAQTGSTSTSTPDPRLLPPPYRAVPIPGKGLGLVASRPLAAHETLLARTPAVMVDDVAFRRLGRARLAALLARAVDDLPRRHRAGYLALTAHDEAAARARGERAYEVFMKNNFRTPVEGVEVFHSTFTEGE